MLLTGAVASCSAFTVGPADTVNPIPTFSSDPARQAAGAPSRETLLPTDCADVLPDDKVSALLGLPVDGIQGRTVIGVGSPSVGRLERVTCRYHERSDRAGSALDLNLYAYTDADAALRQMGINVAAERSTSSGSEEFMIGAAKAALLTQRNSTMLLVANGQYTVAMTLVDGIVPADVTRPVMVDLVQRVLPELPPRQVVESR